MMTAFDAIERSISHNEIVHCIAIGTVQIELNNQAEDWVDTNDEEGEMLREYWGRDQNEDTWRVHLHGATSD